MTALIVLCTCPDDGVGKRIAGALIEEHLAACVNRLPGVASTYRWQGKLCHDSEQLLLIKTTHARFDALRERIVELHPYELPEVIALDVAAASAGYLAWIEAQVQPLRD